MRPSLVISLVIGLAAAALVAIGIGSVGTRGRQAQHKLMKPRMLFMSPTGTDDGRCTRMAPCVSLPRAYRVAEAGDVVELAAGTYDASDQKIRFDSTKNPAAPVLFRPARDAAVTITAVVKVAAARVVFRDMRFAGGWFANGDRLTFKNIDSTAMYIVSGSNIKVLGGQVYPGPAFQGADDADPLLGSETNGKPPTNILIDGVWFHGWLRPPGTDYHTECFQAGSGVHVVIRRSRFSDCATHDLFIQSWGALNGADNSLDDWVLENNVLDRTRDGYYSMQILNGDDGGKPAHFLVRNNAWAQDVHIDVDKTTSVDVISNVGAQSQWQCGSPNGTVTWSDNVFTAARCSKSDRRAPVRVVNAIALALRSPRPSATIDSGNPTDAPALHIVEATRSRGARPDDG